MQLAGEQQQESLYSSMRHDFKTVTALAQMFFAVFSTTLVVFLRYRFGERYLKSWLFVFAFLLIMLGSVFGGNVAAGAGYESNATLGSGALVLYAWAFVFLGIWHIASGILRRRRGERWHSRCPGISHLMRILPFNLYITQRFVEPIFGAALGALIAATLSAPLGAFMIWSAYALFIVETINASAMRNRVLDLLDRQIEAEEEAAVLVQGKPLAETKGFTVFGAESMSQEARADLAGATSRLEPELQDLVEGQKA